MEAVRPRSESGQQISDSLIDFSDSLPAPPEPFPAFQDVPSPSTNAVEATLSSHVINKDLSAIQSTCMAALASLLTPNVGDPSGPLTEMDRPLAAALMELLETTYDLDSFGPSPAYEEVAGPSVSHPSRTRDEVNGARGEDSFTALARHLENVQVSTRQVPARTREDMQSAIDVYRQEVAAERVQTLSRVILGMIRGREVDPASCSPNMPEVFTTLAARGAERRTSDSVPDYARRQSTDLPGYAETAGINDIKDQKTIEAGPSSPLRLNGTSEKMLHDLDDLTTAIERLSSLAPQYADQRSTLRPTRTRSNTPPTVSEAGVNKGKGKERRMSDKAMRKELEGIWSQIERTHGKKRMSDDQRVDMDGIQGRRAEERGQVLQELYDRAEMSRLRGQDGEMGMKDADMARARDLRDRDKFLRDLLEVSASSRLEDQDASVLGEAQLSLRREEMRETFIKDLLETMQSGRLDAQDYPLSSQDRIQKQRQQLVDSLLSFSTSGRMSDQDSFPPTPLMKDTDSMDPYELVTMENFFKDGPPLANGKEENDRARGSSIAEDKKVGTFEKIKGMMKRRSQGPVSGPKSGKDLDLQQVNYVAEHQENLNIVTITLFGPNLPLNSDLQLKSFDPSSCPLPAVEVLLQTGDSSLRIPMPVPIHPHQSAPLVIQGQNLETKFASIPMTSFAPTLISSISHPLSATELRQLDPRGICCTSCDRDIALLSAVSGTDERFKDLPSEHWAEMMEVWMCHDDPGFTAKLASQTKEGFWPTRGKVLVGGSYMLVNSSDMKRGNITQVSTKDISWDVLGCQCGEVLGKARKEDGKPGAGTVRLSKWAIALLSDDDVDGETVESTRYPIGVFVTSDMLSLAQAHATFRFIVIDEEKEEQKIIIWLFNPSVRISYRRAPSTTPPVPSIPRRYSSARSDTPSRRSSMVSSASRAESDSETGQPHNLRVCKIMYRQIESGGLDTSAQGQMEELRYPTVVVERLVRALQSSRLVYPEDRRKMGTWNVGFLRRM